MKVNEESLKTQIIKLIDEYIDEDSTIVGVLRYGAHIPHIYYNACLERFQKPKNISLMLSHMLTFFPPDFYNNRKFILLDDTVYRGNAMRSIKSTLLKCGVLDKNISTAALIVHDQSKFKTDFPSPNISFPNAEYITWKEVLGSLVAQDIRPTDRDHPLYFFELKNISPGRFIDILQNFGWVHSSSTSVSDVLKIIITVDACVIKDELTLSGVDFGSIYKLRVYWRQDKDGVRITIAPMGFPIIDIDKFISGNGAHILASRIGLNKNFFEDIYNLPSVHPREFMLFYFVSRSIAAFILDFFLNQVIHALKEVHGSIRFIAPSEMDGPIHYCFPDEYENFYISASGMVNKTLSNQNLDSQNLAKPQVWPKLKRFIPQLQKDPLMPKVYEILGFLAKHRDPVKWDGRDWVQNNEMPEKGVTINQLINEFKDPLFISRALDELLESGLLRARDLSIGKKNKVFTRQFLPGGEYNAIQVSRVADTLKHKLPKNIKQKFAEEEAVELWGRY